MNGGALLIQGADLGTLYVMVVNNVKARVWAVLTTMNACNKNKSYLLLKTLEALKIYITCISSKTIL